MLWVCVLITFSSLCAIVGGGLYFKKLAEEQSEQILELQEQLVIAMAWMDRFDRKLDGFRKDFDEKLGPSLTEKVNAVLAIGKKPSRLVMGKDKNLHAIRREY